MKNEGKERRRRRRKKKYNNIFIYLSSLLIYYPRDGQLKIMVQEISLSDACALTQYIQRTSPLIGSVLILGSHYKGLF